jgi:hypothetical protein
MISPERKLSALILARVAVVVTVFPEMSQDADPINTMSNAAV